MIDMLAKVVFLIVVVEPEAARRIYCPLRTTWSKQTSMNCSVTAKKVATARDAERPFVLASDEDRQSRTVLGSYLSIGQMTYSLL